MKVCASLRNSTASTLRIFFLCAGLFLTSLARADTLTSLSQAVEAGLKNNFEIRLQKIETQKADNNMLMGKGAFLPEANASGSVSRSFSSVDSDNPNRLSGDLSSTTYNAGVNLNWTLFDGFRMFHAYASLKERKEFAGVAERQVVESTVLNIVDAFFSLWMQIQLWESAKLQNELSKEQFERLKIRQEHGAATRSELLQAEVNYNADRADVFNTELQVRQLRSQLRVLLALGEGDSLAPRELQVPESLGDKEEWRTSMEQYNASLSLAKRSTRLAELENKMAASAFWPTIAATGNLSWTRASTDLENGPVSSVTEESSNFSVGLNARIPLLAGFRNLTAKRNARLDVEGGKLNESVVTLRLKNLFEDQWYAMELAFRQMEWDEKALKLAEENLDIAGGRYEMGAIGSLEFREAQLSLQRARVQALTTQYRALQAVYQIRHLAGKVIL